MKGNAWQREYYLTGSGDGIRGSSFFDESIDILIGGLGLSLEKNSRRGRSGKLLGQRRRQQRIGGERSSGKARKASGADLGPYSQSRERSELWCSKRGAKRLRKEELTGQCA